MLLKNVPEPSEYVEATIGLNSQYKWGDGWGKGYPQNALDFENEVYPPLGEMGYYQGDDGYIYSAVNDMTKIYPHPMEFTGIMTNDDIATILDILNMCDPRIVSVIGVETRPIYAIDERQYLRILEDNQEIIIDWLKSEMKTYCYTDRFVEGATEDFCLYHRLLMLGREEDYPSNGYSSDNVDYNYIYNLAESLFKSKKSATRW